jgi:perosamine synthetase
VRGRDGLLDVTGNPLPYGRHQISDEDVEAVAAALRSALITQGPTVEEFEQALAGYLGARHAVAYSSGTAALHGAAFAAGLQDGDESLVPPLTFVASANCALYQGARPRFVDVDRATWNLDCAAAVAVASERTRTVVPVSFAGLPADLGGLDAIRDRVVLIEDACHALGARRGDVPVGGPGGADITCFSLHPVKSMTTGEGGVAVTEDDELAGRLRMFRTHGLVKEGLERGPYDGDWYMEMQELGFNYRITDFQCALGLSQLGRLDAWIARRNELASHYRRLLADDDRVQLPPAAPAGSLHAYHLFVVLIRAGAKARYEVFARLRESGIGVQVHYIPVYRMPYYRDVLGYPQDECPVADEYYAGAISLPMFPAMRDEDVEDVVDRLCALL